MVKYITSLRNRLCLRARFFALLENDNARKIAIIRFVHFCRADSIRPFTVWSKALAQVYTHTLYPKPTKPPMAVSPSVATRHLPRQMEATVLLVFSFGQITVSS